MAKRRRNPWNQPIHKDLRTQIVAVDDEFHIRFLLNEALPKKGYEVYMAESGTEALDLLAEHPIDIAIVDINMPVMSGLELVSRIHAEYPRVEIILMTGKPDAYDAVACSKMGDTEVLLKPITRDRLLNAVEVAKKAAKERSRMPAPTRGASMTVVLAEEITDLEPAPGRVPPEQGKPPPRIPQAPSREELSTAMATPPLSAPPQPAPEQQQPVQFPRQKPRMATAKRPQESWPQPVQEAQYDPDDTSMMEQLFERVIAGYRVIKPLAVSDFGVVFLVEKRDGDSWQRYGMKIISFDPQDPRTPGKVEHLLSEAETVQRINHPKIAKPVEVGIDEGAMPPCIVYSFVHGCLLSVMIQKKMLNFYLRVRLLSQTASGLAAMHARQLCHRTLKPENIILDNQAHVQLLDFGFASIPISNLDVQSILRRLSYHAPETLTEGQVIPESDVYTLGVVAYTVFLGGNPFERDTPEAVTHAIHNIVPSLLAERIPNFPQDLSDLIARALEKDPRRRPTSAEMSSNLQVIVNRMEPRTDIPLPAYEVQSA